MTKVRFHGPIAGFSGAMGELVFADHEKKGRTVAYMKKEYEPSEKQLDVRRQIAEGDQYVKLAKADPVRREWNTNDRSTATLALIFINLTSKVQHAIIRRNPIHPI